MIVVLSVSTLVLESLTATMVVPANYIAGGVVRNSASTRVGAAHENKVFAIYDNGGDKFHALESRAEAACNDTKQAARRVVIANN